MDRQVINWRVSELTPHPSQDDVFFGLTDDQFDALIRDIDENGIQTALEITEDGVIISGHQRRRAAIELEMTHVPVVVRDDLDEHGAEERLIEANSGRRHMGPIANVKTAIRSHELKYHREPGGKHEHFGPPPRLAQAVAEKLGCVVRNARRLIRIVRECPPCVQLAIDDQKVKRCQAERVCKLSEADKNEIEDRVQSGEAVDEVVVEYLRLATSKSDGAPAQSPGRQLRKLADELNEAMARGIPTKDVGLTGDDYELIVDAFERAESFCRRVCKRMETVLVRKRRNEEALKQLLEEGINAVE